MSDPSYREIDCRLCDGTGDRVISEDWIESCDRCFGTGKDREYLRTCTHCDKQKSELQFFELYDCNGIYAGKACRSCWPRVSEQKRNYNYNEFRSEEL